MTLDYNGNLKIFKCEPQTSTNLSCLQVEKAVANIKDEIFEILDQVSYSNILRSIFAFRSKEADGKSTTAFYSAESDGIKKLLEISGEGYQNQDAATSSDDQSNFYAAAISLKSQSVTVTIKTKDEKSQTESIDFQTVRAKSAQDFCPSFVEFDPLHSTKLHILSNCKSGRYYGSNHIYTIDVSNTEFFQKKMQKKVVEVESTPVDVDLESDVQTEIKFCPFADYFVLLIPQTMSLITVKKTQNNINRSEVDLK